MSYQDSQTLHNKSNALNEARKLKEGGQLKELELLLNLLSVETAEWIKKELGIA